MKEKNNYRIRGRVVSERDGQDVGNVSVGGWNMKIILSIPILLVLFILYGYGNLSEDSHKNKGKWIATYSKSSNNGSVEFGDNKKSKNNLKWLMNHKSKKFPGGNLIKGEDASIIVNSKKSLISALDAAKSGDIIYIRDNAIIDLSNINNIIIPQGVTLASGRCTGQKKGALLYSTILDKDAWQLFRIEGDNVRITGIRFRGPSVKAGSPPWAMCIKTFNHFENIEIDHNEFFGWPRAAIEFDGYKLDKDNLSSVHIHNNYIHHNLGSGFGYGVVISSAYALIEKNVFDQNRHSIAASGDPESGYEARSNVVLDKNSASSHSFDMHRFGRQDTSGPAGEFIKIHKNTFLYSDKPAFIIRGKPTDQAIVENNTFAHKKIASSDFPYYYRAVRQKNKFGNLNVRDNRFGKNHQHELGFGDFDGDNSKDIFWADGQNWWVSSRGQLAWKHFSSSNITLKDLAFGDFDGDGKTDVFRTHKGRKEWLVSYGGTSKWTKIGTSNIGPGDLAFGDFDGDGKTDVFRTNTSKKEWLVSYGGTSRWTKISTSGIGLGDLAFGDFNGDGKTDVFRTHTGRKEWLVSYGGTSKWTKISTSGIGLGHLAFGDFNGDGKTDVFRTNTNKKEWLISHGGTSKWIKLGTSSIGLKKLSFGDFDGDGKTDVFRRKGTEWYVSWAGKSKWEQINAGFDGDL